MTNKPFGTLYIGVTSDLVARVWQHRNGKGSNFCRRHGLTRLVYAEEHAGIYEAIAREKAMKAWNRNWKLRQIMDLNPSWDDLSKRSTISSLTWTPAFAGVTGIEHYAIRQPC